tara:strand:- start:77 stop:457 length:381 start_codon:yes stop_codon:yes gene_type:complete
MEAMEVLARAVAAVVLDHLALEEPIKVVQERESPSSLVQLDLSLCQHQKFPLDIIGEVVDVVILGMAVIALIMVVLVVVVPLKVVDLVEDLPGLLEEMVMEVMLGQVVLELVVVAVVLLIVMILLE